MLLPATPTPNAGTFASLLAGFAAPSKQRDQALDLDRLEDDVATISYEQALKAHTRKRPVEAVEAGIANDAVLPPRKPPASVRIAEWAPETVEPSNEADSVEPGSAWKTSLKDDRKSASITIRLTQVECAQVHGRAAEAGLTMSAYLRSCILEAETLRAQVKEALAQLRRETAVGAKGPAQSDATAAPISRSRFLPKWHWAKRPPAD